MRGGGVSAASGAPRHVPAGAHDVRSSRARRRRTFHLPSSPSFTPGAKSPLPHCRLHVTQGSLKLCGRARGGGREMGYGWGSAASRPLGANRTPRSGLHSKVLPTPAPAPAPALT
jgi:hypothetical protein